MGEVHIITDSSARFENRRFAEEYNITVVPNRVFFGDRMYLDGRDISAEEVLQRMRHDNAPLRVQGPTVEAFQEVYQQLTRITDQIFVVLHSQQLSEAYRHAQAACAGLLGRCDITVIDSQTASAGLGYLVEAMAEAVEDGARPDDLVRITRSAIARLYSVYYVETLDYIQRSGLLATTQSIIGAMLDIKPLITLEDGKLITMEKARTHVQAIDKMIEFVAEFTEIEKMCILQNTLRVTERTRILQDRLALEFEEANYPLMLYDPLIASYLGPDAMGMVVLEGEQ